MKKLMVIGLECIACHVGYNESQLDSINIAIENYTEEDGG